MILLENENIKVAISPKGAELQSIHSKTTDFEYLWKGDPQYWGKFSPVLFPIVGALKDNKYIFGNQEYELPRHGFARDHEFDFEQISNEEVLFTLSQTADTLKVYPFEFKLGLRYQIAGTKVSCNYEVYNPGLEALLFSVGGHPAFAAPLTAGSVYEDYYLEFNKDESITYHKIEDNLIADETASLVLDDSKLVLKHELFYNDALVIKELKSDSISLKNKRNQHGLTFNFENFPYFGIWAARDADFICLEPWCGIADGVNHNQQLRDKEGIISLSPGLDWKRSWSVEVF
ncbi:aldose 1-epimerase family protein [Pedobacter sp. MR2016-24]|uniref:aldose 1-epimerase family protein n=1 Tax=Pedobacter sp. MR2016-24 TaxID=2994466 RepID=UPI002248004D|nr:aldose 1-epimerase family protein [Pedobacter sp. MR2016-24]MCX2485952.1 aldose 1-epimerase family protein [Pedobacter sp. MR2016-24]